MGFEQMEQLFSERKKQDAEKIAAQEKEEMFLLRSREIAAKGDCREIIEKLRAEDLLIPNVARIRARWGDVLPLHFLEEKDWELFAALELFHSETFEHSLRTYCTAKEKVEKRLPRDIVLKDLFNREGVSLDQFYRTCLFHDIGKTALPQTVIQNTVSKDKAIEILTDLINKDSGGALAKKIGIEHISNSRHSREVVAQAAERAHIHPPKIIPIKFLLSPDACADAQEKGFQKEMPLGELLEAHEEQSGVILENLGFGVESEIVRQHHNYRHEPLSHPVAIDSLKISIDMADILHLADITDALRYKRSYKEGFSLLETLSILSSHAQQGLVGMEITHLWIADELKKMGDTSLDALSDEDRRHFDDIKLFLTQSDPMLANWLIAHAPTQASLK